MNIREIAFSSTHHSSQNLTFCKRSAQDLPGLLAEHSHKRVVLFSSGSLQYVQPEHMPLFFKSIATHPAAQVLISEPGDNRFGDPMEQSQSICRGTFSWTHNYRFYAEQAGIKTAQCRIIKPFVPEKDFPSHRRHTIVYFYAGTSGTAQRPETADNKRYAKLV